MKLRVLGNFLAIVVIALFSYNAANAQVVEKVKEAADKTKEVTVDTTKKTVELTKDTTGKVAGKTKDATVGATKSAGRYTVRLVDNVKGQSYEGGRWIVESNWNGTKWVSKRVWIATKNAASTTKDAVVGNDNKQQ